MNHTPGPWTVELDLSGNGNIDVVAAEMLPIAIIDVREYPEDTGSVPRETAIMNAHLIASAPRLLAALKKLKAEVAGLVGISELRPIIGNTNFNVLIQRWDEAQAAIAEAERADSKEGLRP